MIPHNKQYYKGHKYISEKWFSYSFIKDINGALFNIIDYANKYININKGIRCDHILHVSLCLWNILSIFLFLILLHNAY